MSNSSKALSKPYITNCVVCNKYIPDELQSSTRKYCSAICYVKANRKKQVKRRINKTTDTQDPELTRRKMQEEINSLSLGKEEE